MHLIKRDIVTRAGIVVANFSQFTNIKPEMLPFSDLVLPRIPENLHVAYSDAVEFYVTGFIASMAQTVIFNSNQIMGWLDAVDRQMNANDYPIPFHNMVIQFSEPIPEEAFLSGHTSWGRKYPEKDTLLGLVIAFPQENLKVVNVIGWYGSKEINRVLADGETGEIVFRPLFPNSISEQAWVDKQRLFNLAMLCIAYINSPKVVVEKVGFDKAMNARRVNKGKKALEDYYVCRLSDIAMKYATGNKDTERHVSFQFPVIGYWRPREGPDRVRVKPHFRGLAHGEESMKPKVYEVKNEI